MKRMRIALLLVIALGAFPLPSQAVPIIASPTGLPGPITTLTFDEVVLPNGTPVTTEYSAFGVTFTGLYYDPQPTASGPNISPPDLGNFQSFPPLVGLLNPFSISFSVPVSSAAFAIVTNVGSTTFDALLGSTVVESFTAPTAPAANPNTFYGFTGITFDQIRVTVGATLFNQAALIDNLQRPAAPPSEVPEPGSLGLLASSLVALGWLRRRRTASPLRRVD